MQSWKKAVVAGSAIAVDGPCNGQFTLKAVASAPKSIPFVMKSSFPLVAIEGVRVYGPPPSRPRTPTVSFAVRGRDSEGIARHLSDKGLFVSHGDFYASTAVDRLGHAKDGLVRVGCACYTTEAEVVRLTGELRDLVGA